MKKKNITLEMSKQALKDMANDEFKTDFSNLIRSRYPIFYVTTNEEKRFVNFVDHFSRVYGRKTYLWNFYEGLSDINTGDKAGGVTEELKGDPRAVLDYIISQAKIYEGSRPEVKRLEEKGINGILYVLLDFHRFINPAPDIERRLKTIASLSTIVTVVIAAPHYKSTEVIENLIPMVDFPYANPNEIKHALYEVVYAAEQKLPDIRSKTTPREEELIASVSGLTIIEAQNALSKSIVAHKDWVIPTILQEKRQIINKGGVLEYFDKTVHLEDVGGLKNLTHWIRMRRKIFSSQAKDYGLQFPRGLLLIGLPGCGKSYVAKAISGSWEMPLLRLDFGKLFQSLVGDSEKNARAAIKQAEAIAPVILWVDEIEKAISGVRSTGRLDSGVTARVLSTFLTWMQEKTSPVFVVATANDHERIPPEFTRAGRFDEIFFIDLPTLEERQEIFNVLLGKRKVQKENFDLYRLGSESEGYSGAEIEKAIDNAMLLGFEDKQRPIDTDDVVKAMQGFYPLSVMRQGEFDELKEWAEKRCLKANASSKDKIDYGLRTQRDLEI